MKKRTVVLVIRDGWGEGVDRRLDKYNAVRQAKTPVSDWLTGNCGRTLLRASGLAVGLPDGVMGNSEVGHQNIGAGRVVDQEIVRIDKAFEGGELSGNKVLGEAFRRGREGGKLHLMGLVSDGGVHSVMRHLEGLIELAKEGGVKEVYIHAFMDGRDTGPRTGLGYIEGLEGYCKKVGVGKVVSVVGRYWAMDRDKRWERVERAYNCLTGRDIEREAGSAKEAVEWYYENPLDETRQGDEFIVPTVVGDGEGRIEAGDAVVFFNFRGDRPRELVRAFIEEGFSGFERERIGDLYMVTMTEYEEGLCRNVVFPRVGKMKGILGEVVSKAGVKQFRCAETEKYPHVTFFFNDYREEGFEGEERVLVASPRDVATYDLKPEMSAHGVAEAAERAILGGGYGLVVVNFANADMVGHTGSMEAAVKAVETVDSCLGKLIKAVEAVKGVVVVTADHGNADQMWDPVGKVAHTQHTLNPVELVIYDAGGRELYLRPEGKLGDIAPTVLELMGLERPEEMSGKSLIVNC